MYLSYLYNVISYLRQKTTSLVAYLRNSLRQPLTHAISASQNQRHATVVCGNTPRKTGKTRAVSPANMEALDLNQGAILLHRYIDRGRMKPADFAAWIGASVRTVQRWLAGTHTPGKKHTRRIFLKTKITADDWLTPARGRQRDAAQ